MTNPTPDTMSDGTLESSRRLAGQALERASEKFRDLGFGMKDLAHKGVSTVADRTHAAQREMSRYATATGRYVTEQPLKSALIAAAIGAAVAGLIIALRHNRHD